MATYIRGVAGVLEEIERQRKQAERDRLGAENSRLSRGGKRPTPRELKLEGEVGALIALHNFLKEATIMPETDYDRFMAGVHARSTPAFVKAAAGQ